MTETATKPEKKFRLLQGMHHDGKRFYEPGDIIASSTDLTRFNTRKGRKFERMTDDVPATPAKIPNSTEGTVGDEEDVLSTMTIEQLTQFAADEEIDLGGVKGKKAILAKIREGLTPADEESETEE